MIKRMLLAASGVMAVGAAARADEWAAYGRDPGGTRFSPLDQITPANVTRLKPAWTFHTGDIADGSAGPRSGFETTPLLVDGRLYLTTPFNRIIALDPATGRQLWAYDPAIDRTLPYGDGLINRGVAPGGTRPRGAGPALAALRGDHRCAAGLRRRRDRPAVRRLRDRRPGQSARGEELPAGRLSHDLAAGGDGRRRGGGSAIDDNSQAEMPDGVVRGFDARTGRLLWSWRPLERPAGVKAESWKTGAANAWSILAADPKRHLVFLPTGSAQPRLLRRPRPGDNRWANSVVALHVRTGKLAWGFQLVHHDLWDYDTAAAPLATTFKLNGRPTPVVIAGNKTGMVYALDPATGKPVLPIEERPTPTKRHPRRDRLGHAALSRHAPQPRTAEDVAGPGVRPHARRTVKPV